MVSSQVFAKPTEFRAESDKNKATLGQTILLSLIFEGEQNVPAPDLPELDGFRSQYLGPSTNFSMINGKTSMSIAHRYLLFPQKKGVFEIGPFSVMYEGQAYTSGPLTVEITDEAPSNNAMPEGQAQGPQTHNKQDLQNRIFLKLESPKTEAYVNESIPVTVKLYSDRLPVRVEKLPEFEGGEGFSVSDLKDQRPYKEVRENVPFDVLEFRADVHAVKPGDLSLGHAIMTPILVLRRSPRHPVPGTDMFEDDFFSAVFSGWEEPYPLNLRSEALNFRIKPLPQEGKPDHFSGAVGKFSMQMETKQRTIKEGDPISLIISVSGEGNFNTVSAPVLEGTDDFKIYEPQLIESAPGLKRFEQIVIPLTSLVNKTPYAVFSFFEPRSSLYQTVNSGPYDLQIEPQPKTSEPEKAQGKPPVASIKEQGQRPERKQNVQEITFIKENFDMNAPKEAPLYDLSFWLLQLVPALGLTGVYTLKKRSETMRGDNLYGRRIQAYRKARKALRETESAIREGNAFIFYERGQKALREYLGGHFQIACAGLTAQSVDRFMAPLLPGSLRSEIASFLEECDVARFSGVTAGVPQMRSAFIRLSAIIEKAEKINV